MEPEEELDEEELLEEELEELDEDELDEDELLDELLEEDEDDDEELLELDEELEELLDVTGIFSGVHSETVFAVSIKNFAAFAALGSVTGRPVGSPYVV